MNGTPPPQPRPRPPKPYAPTAGKTFGRNGSSSFFNGATLRELRIEAGLTQVELAHQVGISGKGVSDIEADAYKPSDAVVTALSHALGVSRAQFFDED